MFLYVICGAIICTFAIVCFSFLVYLQAIFVLKLFFMYFAWYCTVYNVGFLCVICGGFGVLGDDDDISAGRGVIPVAPIQGKGWDKGTPCVW